jgi:hypothetical protein
MPVVTIVTNLLGLIAVHSRSKYLKSEDPSDRIQNKMKTENENYQPEVEILTTRKEIDAAIRRLNTRNLLSEAIHQIHVAAERDPNGAHATTAFDTNGKEILLVGSVFRNGLFADLGILADGDSKDLKVYNTLMRIFEDYAEVLSQRMTRSCICDQCLAKIEESIVSVEQPDPEQQ